MKHQKSCTIMLSAAILLTSFTLRGPIAAVGPLIGLIGGDLHVSTGALGFITTLPLLTFAVSSLIIPRIAKRLGLVEILLIGLACIAAGAIGRSLFGYGTILLGTLGLGLGISSGNVLLPAIIKKKVPLKIGIFTSLYLCGQNLAASVGAGFSYPLATMEAVDWRISLAVWAVPALLALLAWFLFLRVQGRSERAEERREAGEITKPLSMAEQQSFAVAQPAARLPGLPGETPPAPSEPAADAGGLQPASDLKRSALAWCITMVMGLQSTVYYVMTAWLPAILGNTGMSGELAGFMALFFQLFSLPATFLTPVLIARIREKSIPAVFSGLCYLVGILGLLFFHAPVPVVLSLVVLASGSGASFAWVVAMIAVVTRDAAEASRLSGMSQAVGYLMAAAGPTIAGLIVDLTANWSNVLVFAACISALIIVFGWLSRGRTLF